jgi:hypothetical protein
LVPGDSLAPPLWLRAAHLCSVDVWTIIAPLADDRIPEVLSPRP